MRAVVGVMALLVVPFTGHAFECGRASSMAVAAQPTVLAAVSPELMAPRYRLGTHGGVLSRDDGQVASVDQVLERLRLEGCANVAAALPDQAVVSPDDPAAYVKQTEFDNTPYRFSMTQEGRRMTADDFDAWLQANGYSVGRRVDPNAPADAPDLPVAPGVDAASGQ